MNPYDKLTDEKLIALYRSGDKNVVDFLLGKYKYMVRKKARAMYLIGGENDDLIQEGMIGLMKALRDYSSSRNHSFSNFAELCVSRQMATAVEASKRKKNFPLNSYVSIYEKESGDKTKLPLIDTMESSVENDPEALFFGREFAEAFTEKLKQNLSEFENHVLYLHLMGTDHKKIAELLQKRPKAVDNAMQRIRTKAGKLLRE